MAYQVYDVPISSFVESDTYVKHLTSIMYSVFFEILVGFVFDFNLVVGFGWCTLRVADIHVELFHQFSDVFLLT